MSGISDQQLAAYLGQHPLPGFGPSTRVQALPTEDEALLWRVTSDRAAALVKVYPSASARARREIAGLQLGGTLSLAPTLLLADEDGTALGGPVVAYEEPRGAPLGERRLSAEDAHDWLFLLLTLHHLPASSVALASSMSPDIVVWWQRNQPAWEACRATYAGARHKSLLDALVQLHAIVGARVEARRDLWQGIARRPCHGNPVPAHILRTGGRLVLVEWDGFGLGDPAMEMGRAAALAALSGELDTERYVTFVAEYLAGMRDTRDATLEDRLQVFASVLPLGVCFSLLQLLADGQLPAGERQRHIAQVSRALTWIQDTLGLQVGEPTALLATV